VNGAEMGRLLGRTVIVDNKSGAGGNLAVDAVAKAAPGGSTLLLSSTRHTVLRWAELVRYSGARPQ
jgi:tripartite-type tricarboxylate transporter receptor subunit TctC